MSMNLQWIGFLGLRNQSIARSLTQDPSPQILFMIIYVVVSFIELVKT